MRAVTTSPPACVAPHAGAWIETQSHEITNEAPIVAPHAGAWIETVQRETERDRTQLPPTRGHGLKLPPIYVASLGVRCPPRGGMD